MKVWDPRQKDDPVACMTPAEGEMKRDCWTVAFGMWLIDTVSYCMVVGQANHQPVTLLFFSTGNSFNDDERCVCAGYDNGDIKLFDLRTMTLRWEANAKNGVRIAAS